MLTATKIDDLIDNIDMNVHVKFTRIGNQKKWKSDLDHLLIPNPQNSDMFICFYDGSNGRRNDPLDYFDVSEHCNYNIEDVAISYDLIKDQLGIEWKDFNVIDVTQDCIEEVPSSLFKLIRDVRDLDEVNRLCANRLPAGYTIVRRTAWQQNDWLMHRPATVLFKSKGKHYLMGQDEDSYFCCQLPKAAKDIEDAFSILTPDELDGRKYSRQGEWYAVSCKKSEIPQATDHCFMYTLPRKNAESNSHLIMAENIVIADDGYVYALNGELIHIDSSRDNVGVGLDNCLEIPMTREHETMKFKGWVYFVENNAVESWSDEGMD